MLTSNAILNIPASQRVKTNVDDRPTLAKFRRSGLYIILKHNGHDNITEHMPHTEMLAYAKAHEHELTLDGLTVTPAEYGGFNVAKPRDLIEQEKVMDDNIQAKRKAISEKFTKDEATDWDALQAEARELGVDTTRMKGEEIIAAIVDAKKDEGDAGYESLSWPDLKKAAKERGIETHARKKGEIIAALKGE